MLIHCVEEENRRRMIIESKYSGEGVRFYLILSRLEIIKIHKNTIEVQ